MSPAMHTGAEILNRSGIMHRGSASVMLVFRISPGKTYSLLRKFLYKIREVHYDISPEHGTPVVFNKIPAYLSYKIDIHPVSAYLFREILTSPLSEVKGLVTAEIELL